MKSFFHKFFAVIAPIGLLLLLALDQWTKTLAVNHLKGNAPFVIWENVFEFRYFENTGAAWGILQNRQIFFYILTVVFGAFVLIEIFRLHRKVRYMPFVYTLVFLLAGALGNFIDRLINQYVVDFIYVKIIDFPIFNLADCYITISVFIMVLLIMFYYTDDEFNEIIPGISGKKKKEQ